MALNSIDVTNLIRIFASNFDILEEQIKPRLPNKNLSDFFDKTLNELQELPPDDFTKFLRSFYDICVRKGREKLFPVFMVNLFNQIVRWPDGWRAEEQLVSGDEKVNNWIAEARLLCVLNWARSLEQVPSAKFDEIVTDIVGWLKENDPDLLMEMTNKIPQNSFWKEKMAA